MDSREQRYRSNQASLSQGVFPDLSNHWKRQKTEEAKEKTLNINTQLKLIDQKKFLDQMKKEKELIFSQIKRKKSTIFSQNLSKRLKVFKSLQKKQIRSSKISPMRERIHKFSSISNAQMGVCQSQFTLKRQKTKKYYFSIKEQHKKKNEKLIQNFHTFKESFEDQNDQQAEPIKITEICKSQSHRYEDSREETKKQINQLNKKNFKSPILPIVQRKIFKKEQLNPEKSSRIRNIFRPKKSQFRKEREDEGFSAWDTLSKNNEMLEQFDSLS